MTRLIHLNGRLVDAADARVAYSIVAFSMATASSSDAGILRARAALAASEAPGGGAGSSHSLPSLDDLPGRASVDRGDGVADAIR